VEPADATRDAARGVARGVGGGVASRRGPRRVEPAVDVGRRKENPRKKSRGIARRGNAPGRRARDARTR
jgi:hypothetical protein